MMTKSGSKIEWVLPSIVVIGMGMSREDLGTAALDWIGSAEVLVGGRRHLDLFPDHPGQKIDLRSPISKQLELLEEISQSRRTAVLASGDPLFFGIGRKLHETFGKERLIVLPNVTSVQVLCARLKEPWDEVETVSLHGRDDSSATGRMIESLQRGRRVAVYTDHVHTPQWIAERLIGSGEPASSLVVGEDLGTDSERIREFSLPEVKTAGSFSPLNLVLIRPRDRVEKPVPQPGDRIFGFFEDEFEREAGLITKMEVRAVALAMLGLAPGQVIWDIGAGTGSVSIEAGRISHSTRVFAIEKSRSRYSKLLDNIRKFNASHMRAVSGDAPEALKGLPDPDRVFIGGSGSNLSEILRVVSDRLRPDGVVIQTIVVLETLEKVKNFWAEKGCEVSITQLQVSRSVPIGNSLRLEALNPVFIVSSRRKQA